MEPAHKRQKMSPGIAQASTTPDEHDGESTDFKLAILTSLHPDRSQEVLLDYLLAYDGSVDAAASALAAPEKNDGPRKQNAINGYQSSLSSFARRKKSEHGSTSIPKPLTKKGRTLHLYVRLGCSRSVLHCMLSNIVLGRYRTTHPLLHDP